MIFGIIGNIEKSELPETLNNFISHLLKNGFTFILDEELSEYIDRKLLNGNLTFLPIKDLIDESDIILSFGGDGTILSVARFIGNKEVPIVGVNLGKLGFLAEIGRDQIYNFINELLNGNYIIEERMVLEAEIDELEDIKLSALNDIVVEKSQTSRLINIKSYLNDEYLITTMSDGLIIATPTGSTAYSLASNGPIVVPSSKVIIINPICPHTLTVRPIIVPDDYIFRAKVESHNGEAMITADGQVEIKLKTPFEIKVKKADYPIKLVKRKDISYYEILRSKLMWGKDLRTI